MELTEYELNELLPYEQPKAYIVESTEYNEAYQDAGFNRRQIVYSRLYKCDERGYLRICL